MKNIIWIVFCLLTPVAFSAPAAAPTNGEAVVYKKADGRELHLYFEKPAGWTAADRRPAIVFFHGGGWVGGPLMQFTKQSQYLAARGMVCVQVEYRLLDRAKRGPPLVCVQDAKSALRWVRAHAAEWGIDPRRIAAGGGSAGGHLAAATALLGGLDDPQDDRAVSPQPDALVLFNPVFDNGPDNYGHANVGERYKEFSPAHNIRAGAPPTLVLQGDQDKLIPRATVERFKAGMDKVGARCDVVFYAGQQHGFFNKDPWQTQTLAEADKFLSSLGWLQGPSTLAMPVNSQNAKKKGQGQP